MNYLLTDFEVTVLMVLVFVVGVFVGHVMKVKDNES